MGQFKDGDSRTINGVTYTRQNGQWLPQSGSQAIGPAIGGNPLIPSQLAGQGLSNTGKSIDNRKAAATLPFDVRKAAADASDAELKLRQDRIEQGLDPDTGKPAAQAGLAGSVHGSDYLNTLPSNEQSLVKAMSEGRLIPPTGRAAASPYWQKLIGQTLQYDPSFDAIDYGARYNTRKDFTSGQSSRNIKALNTAIGHVAQLAGQIPGTASHNFTAANAAENYFNKNVLGSAGPTQFSQTAGAVASELTQVFRGTGGAEADVQRYLSELDPNASAEQKNAAVANILGLLKSRLDALNDQYSKGMGSASAGLDVLDDHSKQALTKYLPGFDAGQYGGTPPRSGGPVDYSGMVPDNYGFTGRGPVSGGTKTVPDAAVSAAVNSFVRSGVPYAQAQRQIKSQFPNTTPISPSQYNAAVKYHRDHPDYQGSFGAATKDVPLSMGERISTGIAQSGIGSGLMRAADKSAAGIPSLMAGDQGAYFNALSAQQHPNYALAGDVGGTVIGALAANRALGAATPFLGRAGQAISATPGRQALTADLLFGGGSGAAQNPDNPLLGATEGVAAMGAGNAAGRYILGPAIRAGSRAVNKVGGMFGGSAPIDIPPPLGAGEGIVMRGAKPSLGDVRTNLQDAAGLNLPYSLSDADPRLRSLAGSAVRKSPDVRALAENTLGPRQLGQGERAIGLIDQHLAPVGDVPAMKADALARAQNASKPLYQKAMDHPTPNDSQINEMLDTPAGQQAARNAYQIALNNGENPAELSFATGPDGVPVINAQPNWKTLQYIKMGMDKVVADNQNPVTGKLDLSDPMSRSLNDLRSRFVSRLGEINPDYASANKAYGDIIGQGAAAERGAAATSPRVTPEQAQIAITNAGPNAPHFQRGYASSMADQVERSRLSGDPFNLIYGSMAQQRKVNMLFPEGAHMFNRGRALEGDMSKTAYETLGGSPTAARMEADRAFENPLADGALELGLMGLTGTPPKNLIKRGLQMVTDSRNLGFRGAQKKADQIGPILLDTDPNAGLQALDEFQRMALERQAYINRTRAAGGMFGAPIVFGLTQN